MWSEKHGTEGNSWMEAAARFNQAAIALQSQAAVKDEKLQERVVGAARDYLEFLKDLGGRVSDAILRDLIKYERDRVEPYLTGMVPSYSNRR